MIKHGSWIPGKRSRRKNWNNTSVVTQKKERERGWERGDEEREREAKREGEIDRRTEIKGREREKDDQQRKMPKKKRRLKEKRREAPSLPQHPAILQENLRTRSTPSFPRAGVRSCNHLRDLCIAWERKGSMQVIADDNINWSKNTTPSIIVKPRWCKLGLDLFK